MLYLFKMGITTSTTTTHHPPAAGSNRHPLNWKNEKWMYGLRVSIVKNTRYL